MYHELKLVAIHLTMKKPALIFGLLACAVIFFYSFIAFMVFGDWNNMTPRNFKVLIVFGYLKYLVLIIAIFLAMRAFRKDTISPNYMSIVKIGLLVTLIIAAFIGIGEFLYILLNPDFIDKYNSIQIKIMQTEGASPGQIAAYQQELETFSFMQNPFLSGIFYFLQTFIAGAIVSLIFGIFLRSKNTIITSQA